MSTRRPAPAAREYMGVVIFRNDAPGSRLRYSARLHNGAPLAADTLQGMRQLIREAAPMRATLKSQGYAFVRRECRGVAIFRELESGKLERYARRAGGYAGFSLQWRGAAWEFCSSSVSEALPHA